MDLHDEDWFEVGNKFDRLHYPLGFFINVDSTKHHLNHYTGRYLDRIHAFAVKLVGGEVVIIHASLLKMRFVRKHLIL